MVAILSLLTLPAAAQSYGIAGTPGGCTHSSLAQTIADANALGTHPTILIREGHSPGFTNTFYIDDTVKIMTGTPTCTVPTYTPTPANLRFHYEGGFAVVNGGELVMVNVTLSNGGQALGGVLRVANGDAYLGNVTLQNSVADEGGAVWVGGTPSNPSTFTCNGCRFLGNWANDGGAVMVGHSGTAEFWGSLTMTNNVALSHGGGLYVASTAEEVALPNDRTISGNQAPSLAAGKVLYAPADVRIRIEE